MQEQEKFLPHYQDFLKKASDFSSFLEQERIQRVFKKFETYLDENTVLEVGVSGGVDSMCLISLLLLRYHQKQYDMTHIKIIHCNHKIRPESEKEAEYLKNFFAGLPFFYFERDENKNKSLKVDENTLRKRRYQCFHEVAEKKGVLYLLTGHHLEDRIETSFLNCMRGASLRGFLNMQTIQQYDLFEDSLRTFRPLLDEVKEDFYRFCQTFHLLFFEDSTNEKEEISQRNWIRKNIVNPLQNNDQTATHFLQSMRRVYQEMEQAEISKHFTLIPLNTLPIRNVEWGFKLQENTRTFTKKEVLDLWKQIGIYYNLTQGKIEDRYQRFHLQKGMKNLKDYYFFFHDHELFIFKTSTKFRELHEETPIIDSIPEGLTDYFDDTYHFHLIMGNKELSGAMVRFPLPTDKIHGKTWNRWCINQKIPLFRRNRIPLAIKDGKIIHIWKNIIHW